MMGYFKFDNFHVKNDVATFLAILGNIGQLFIPSSGHTESLGAVRSPNEAPVRPEPKER